MDDIAEPLVEGPETFEVYLYGAEGTQLGEPQVALVIINDTKEDGKAIELMVLKWDKDGGLGLSLIIWVLDRALAIR